MENKYLTTKEFSKLCGVTKHTLYHYDEIGLLKPKYVSENGYRYYDWRQFSTADLISILKDSGASLKDIKTYLDDMNPNSLSNLLKEKNYQLTLKINRLKFINNLIFNTIKSIDSVNNYPSEPFIEKSNDEFYIIEKLPRNFTEKTFIETVSKHIEYCKKKSYGDDFFIGFALPVNKILNKNFENYYDFVFTKISTPVDDELLYLKKANTCVTYYHKGSEKNISNAYKKIKKFTDSLGFAFTD